MDAYAIISHRLTLIIQLDKRFTYIIVSITAVRSNIVQWVEI